MSKQRNFIDDRYTQPGYIEQADRLHDAMRFEYRPMLVADRQAFFARAEQVSAKEDSEAASQDLAKLIVKWDVVATDGKPVPVAVDAVRRLQPWLWVKLQNIIVGAAPTDIDPEWPDETAVEHSRQLSEAGTRPQDLAELREAADQGNSE